LNIVSKFAILQVYERKEKRKLDKRYYAKKKHIPLGFDPGAMGEGKKLPKDMEP
jgi:hypothetical protein